MYQSEILHIIQIHKPISAVDILSILKKSYPSVNKTTVYRQLEKLKSLGRIQELSFTSLDEKLYELTTNHHHIICLHCKKISCLEGECAISPPSTNFKILGHNLEFFGLCQKCKHI